MSQQLPISVARARLPSLVREVETGAAITLTRRGQRVAVLVSAHEYGRLTAGKVGLWKGIEAFRARHDLAALDLDGVYDDVRDRSPGRDVEL